MAKFSAGEISDFLSTLGLAALGGQPNARGSAAYANAQNAKEQTQGMLAQERAKKLQEEAEKKRKKAALGNIAGTIAGTAANFIPVVGPFVAPMVNQGVSSAVSGQPMDPAAMAGAAVQGAAGGISAQAAKASAPAPESAQRATSAVPAGEDPALKFAGSGATSGAIPPSVESPAPTATPSSLSGEHAVTISHPSGTTVTIGPPPVAGPVTSTLAGQPTGTQPQGATNGQVVQGQTNAPGNAPQGQVGQAGLLTNPGTGSGDAATPNPSPSDPTAGAPAPLDYAAAVKQAQDTVNAANPSVPTPNYQASSSAPAGGAAQGPPAAQNGWQKAASVVQHPVTQALLAGLEKGLTELSSSSAYDVPAVTTPGLRADLAMQVDQAFAQRQQAARADARAAQGMEMDKTRLGFEERRVKSEEARAQAQATQSSAELDLRKQELAQTGANQRVNQVNDVTRNIIAAHQAEVDSYLAQSRNNEDVRHNKAVETNASRGLGIEETNARNQAGAQAAQLQLDWAKVNNDTKKLIQAEDAATHKQIDEAIKANNDTYAKITGAANYDPATAPPGLHFIDQEEAIQKHLQANAAQIGARLQSGEIQPESVPPGVNFSWTQASGQPVDFTMTNVTNSEGKKVAVQQEVMLNYWDETGIAPYALTPADLEVIRSKYEQPGANGEPVTPVTAVFDVQQGATEKQDVVTPPSVTPAEAPAKPTPVTETLTEKNDKKLADAKASAVSSGKAAFETLADESTLQSMIEGAKKEQLTLQKRLAESGIYEPDKKGSLTTQIEEVNSRIAELQALLAKKKSSAATPKPQSKYTQITN